MNTLTMAVMIIGLATFLTVAGALACRKIAAKEGLDEYQGMADPILNVVATLFSILLGFLVAGAMDDFSNTRNVVEQEANSLADVFALSRGIPDPSRSMLQNACKEYCRIVIDQEWQAMAERRTSDGLWDASRKIWDAALAFKPEDDREVNVHEALITAVQQLGENRRSRIVAMREGYSPALWIVVFGGSIILIGCTYMFFIKNTKLQAYMVAMVALSLYLNISLLWIYSHPFVGDLKIKSSAFELDQRIFSHKIPPVEVVENKREGNIPGNDCTKAGEDNNDRSITNKSNKDKGSNPRE